MGKLVRKTEGFGRVLEKSVDLPLGTSKDLGASYARTKRDLELAFSLDCRVSSPPPPQVRPSDSGVRFIERLGSTCSSARARLSVWSRVCCRR